MNMIDNNQKNLSMDYANKFINPEAVVESIEIAPDNIVADFGCGSGFFSIAVAKKIGENGVVYSFDILPQSLESVASRAKAIGLTNIVTKRTNLEKKDGSRLPDKSCDWVILKDMLFQNKDKSAILKEAGRVLKDNGKILVIEWRADDNLIGPDIRVRISREALTEIIQSVGMGVLRQISVSDFHYGLILTK